MADQGVKASMIVTECREVFKGTNKDNEPYTLHVVKATLPNGATVDRAMTSFDAIPLDGKPREFKVTGPRDFKGTPTWTLALPAKGEAMADLKRRVADLETQVEFLRNQMSSVTAELQSRSGPGPATPSRPSEQAGDSRWGPEAPY